MKTQSLVSAALSLLLLGCAEPYKLPPGTQTATLTIRTSSPFNNIPVTAYAKDDCSDKPGRRLALLNSKAAGSTYSPEATVQVAAGHPFIFSVYSLIDIAALERPAAGVKYSWCTPVMTFVPRSGARYEAHHRVVNGTCTVSILEVDASTGTKRPVESARRQTMCSQVMEN